MKLYKVCNAGIVCLTVALASSCGGAGNVDGAAMPDFAMQNITYTREADISRYRADIDRMSERLGDDFLSAIVADDTITADEMNEAQRRVRQCYADAGYEYIQLGEGGAASIGRLDGKDNGNGRDERFQEALQRCESDSGYDSLAPLYYEAVRNPDHLDLSPYTVQCFIDHGLVGPQYTVADYQRDSHARTGPYKVQDEDPEGAQGRQVTECGRDPLGKLR